MMQSMRNGIEKHFVRQLELHSHPQLLSYLFHFVPFLFPFLSCMQIELSEKEGGRKGEREKRRSTYLQIHHISCISFIVYHLSSTFATFSTFVFFGIWFAYVLPKLFLVRYLPHIPWENPTASSPCGRPKGPNDGIGIPGGSGPCGTEWCGCGPP